METLIKIQKWNKYLTFNSIGNVLMKIVDTIIWIIMLFVVLAIYKVDFVNFLYPLATFLVGLSFAFGASAQALINSIVLLFAIHPFDVGDKITIGIQ